MNKEEKRLMFRMLRLIYNKLNNKERIDFGILADLDDKIKELDD